MLGMDIDFFEMGSARLEHLDMGKTHGNVVGKGNPQMSLSLSSIQHCEARRFEQDSSRSVASKEFGRSELDGWQKRNIVWSSNADPIPGRREHV